MVFDGEQLTAFDHALLDDLHRARVAGPVAGQTGSGGARSGPARSGTGPGREPSVLGVGPAGRPRRSSRWAALAMVLFVVLIAGVALVAARRVGDEPARVDPQTGTAPTTTIEDPGVAHVADALARTRAAGRFHLEYSATSAPPASPTQDDCAQYLIPGSDQPVYLPEAPKGSLWGNSQEATVETRPVPALCDSSDPQARAITGGGTLDVGAGQMNVTAGVPGVSVSVRLSDGHIWQSGGQDVTRPLGPGVTPGQPLSSFAPTAESFLGRRGGALAAMRLASPNGYLALEPEAIAGATPAGTGTVDGEAMTTYDVDEDLDRLLAVGGLTPDEHATVQDGLDRLHRQRLTASTARISIDERGLVRHLTSITHFADGGTVTIDATYSAFTCPPGPADPTCPTSTSTASTSASTATTAPTTVEPTGPTTAPGLTGRSEPATTAG